MNLVVTDEILTHVGEPTESHNGGTSSLSVYDTPKEIAVHPPTPNLGWYIVIRYCDDESGSPMRNFGGVDIDVHCGLYSGKILFLHVWQGADQTALLRSVSERALAIGPTLTKLNQRLNHILVGKLLAYMAGPPLEPMLFTEGEPVRKCTGDYTLAGTVVAAFRKKSGVVRYVVEAEEPKGLLMIYSAGNLERREA